MKHMNARDAMLQAQAINIGQTHRFLSAEEIVQLTGRSQPAAQRRQLKRMGINFFENADGCPVVSSGVLANNATENGSLVPSLVRMPPAPARKRAEVWQ